MDGRDVKALDAHGRRVQGQGTLKLEQRLVGAVVGIAGLDHVAAQRPARVVLRLEQQVVLLATNGTVHLARTAALVRQPAPQKLGVLQVLGDVDLRGNVGRLVIVALEETLA